jgi:hypothetical protein
MSARITTTPDVRTGANLSTTQLANTFHVGEQTPRASLCRKGHWMGMVPVKLPNGRLLWSCADAVRLLAGEVL